MGRRRGPGLGALSVNELAAIIAGGSVETRLVFGLVIARYSATRLLVLLNALDGKALYDHRIKELFDLCGQDLDRFLYHVDVELPHQETGALTATGPHAPKGAAMNEFIKARQHWVPGSFWALEYPPTDPNYDWPIRP